MKIITGFVLGMTLFITSAYAHASDSTNNGVYNAPPSSEISPPSPNLDIAPPKLTDMAGFTCQAFKENAEKCQPYNCFTPSNVDPTQVIEWNILRKKGDRCMISNTTDIGLQDENGNPEPITKTCEYDQDGIESLTNMMEDMKAGHFKATQNANLPGSYHCDINSQGNPINHKPTVLLPDDNG